MTTTMMRSYRSKRKKEAREKYSRLWRATVIQAEDGKSDERKILKTVESDRGLQVEDGSSDKRKVMETLESDSSSEAEGGR
mmetsp:Transcript_16187/g.29255  ORF Transcript_16187/g.29255 Transcript_16187/m.29255 type:complete len:81 (+) Transcript_16187:1245-1487(+)